MPYSVEIFINKQGAFDSDEGMPRYRLSGNYVDAASAEAAARKYVGDLGKNLGQATWRVLDERGKDIGLSA